MAVSNAMTSDLQPPSNSRQGDSPLVPGGGAEPPGLWWDPQAPSAPSTPAAEGSLADVAPPAPVVTVPPLAESLPTGQPSEIAVTTADGPALLTDEVAQTGQAASAETVPETGVALQRASRPSRLKSLGRATSIAETVLLVVVGLVVALLVVIDVGPRFLPYQALVVRSGSMSPAIPTGSLVFYKKVQASQLKVGDIIVFDEPGTVNTKITHRIFAIKTGPTGRYFVTKGDANGIPDPWRVPDAGTGWAVAWHVPAVGYALTWLEGGTVRVVLIVVPAVVLAGLAFNDARRARRTGRRSKRHEAPSEVA
jgi:signal peptidase